MSRSHAFTGCRRADLGTIAPAISATATAPPILIANVARLATVTIGTNDSTMNATVMTSPDAARQRSHSGALATRCERVHDDPAAWGQRLE